MLVLNDLSFDGRVRNEAAALVEDGWRVLVIGTQRADGSLPDRETLRGFDVLRVRYGRYGGAKWWPWRWLRHGFQAGQVIRELQRVRTRGFHAHDLPALLLVTLARALRRDRTRVVYDAHELFLFMSPQGSQFRQMWERLTRPVFMWIEGALARRADGVIGLAEGRLRLMARWYRLPDAVVIENALDPVPENAVAPVDLREIVGQGRRCVVHTGYVDVRRRAITESIDALVLLPDDVALVLLGGGEGVGQVMAYAARQGVAGRVYVVDAVGPEAVAVTIRAADAAVIMMRAESWNTRAGLPNKLFEAIAAGVPVVASDNFVLRRMVRRYGLGVLVDQPDPAAIADGILRVLDVDENRAFRESVRAAQTHINWATESARLQAFYREVLS